MDTVNPDNIERINRLFSIRGQQAYAEAEMIEDYLLQRMQLPGSFISDYEIEFRISLWAPEKYAHIEELEGNPFFSYEPGIAYFKKRDTQKEKRDEYKRWLFEVDHNEAPVEFKGQYHCYFFHDLYGHQPVSWQDITDTEEVWVEVVVTVQNFSESGGFGG